MRNRIREIVPDEIGVSLDIVIEPTLAGMADTLVRRIGFAGRRLLFVSDAQTHTALGARIVEELAGFDSSLLLLDANVQADESALSKIAAMQADAYVAIGSGTINDLCKYASYMVQKPYCIFATAPSMNGYVSANASITQNGVKSSRAAHLPFGVFCDMEIIAGAPKRLIRSGLGDSLCRSTAQGDWLLSHLLLDTYYSELPFKWLKPYETELFAHADKLAEGDLHTVELLMRTLLASGLGMTYCKGSYPASQGEHLIAHTMEMKHGHSLPHSYHGEQIGVTTLTMAQIQETLLTAPLQLPPQPGWKTALGNYFDAQVADSLADLVSQKYTLYEQQDAVALRLARREEDIRRAIKAVTLPSTELRKVLEKAGAPCNPAEIGWDEESYRQAVSHAAFTRDRYGFLDLYLHAPQP